MLQRDEYRQMLLAGTVSFPATFPQLGRLSLQDESLPLSGSQNVTFLSVSESPSARVTMLRRVIASSVRAVFVPRDPRYVSYADGQWLLGEEVLPGLEQLLAENPSLEGIAFVPENEPSMLNVSAGMTAGESVQYYPPLPNDPAHNHYNAWPAGQAAQSLAARSEFAGAGACATAATDEEDTSMTLEFLDRAFSCSANHMELEMPEQAIDEPQLRSRAFNAQALWACNAFPADM